MNNELLVRDEVAALAPDYEILEEIGRGGLSVVYLARERELGREVAIKVIRNHFLEDQEVLQRLNREARMLAQLQHPNIVSILSAKRLPDGTLALVMQLARGRTLRGVLNQEGALSCERAVDIMKQTGSALAYLHQRGIVHRDVKPENVFVEAEGRVMLSDLGIAKASDPGTDVTLAGVVIGTPAYMSPEQIDGNGVDGRSDLYSLALAGYEMLSGTRPWAGENLYGIIYKQKTQALPSLTSLRDDIPTGVVEALERAMAKNPDDRWTSVEEFLRHLGGSSSAAPVAAAVPTAVPAVIGPITIATVEPEADPVPEQDEVLAPPVWEQPVHPVPPAPRKRGRTLAIAGVVAVVTVGLGGVAALRASGGAQIGGDQQATAERPPVEQDVASTLSAPLPSPAEWETPTSGLPPAETPSALGPPAGEPPATPVRTASGLPSAARPPAASAEAQQVPAVTAAERRLDSALAAQRIAPRTAASAPPAVPLALQQEQVAAQVRETPPQLRNTGAITAIVSEQYATAVGRNRVAGTTVLDLTVDATGRVVQGRIFVTSGVTALDDIALRAASRMRFTPGERNGVPVQSRVQIPLSITPNE